MTRERVLKLPVLEVAQPFKAKAVQSENHVCPLLVTTRCDWCDFCGMALKASSYDCWARSLLPWINWELRLCGLSGRHPAILAANMWTGHQAQERGVHSGCWNSRLSLAKLVERYWPEYSQSPNSFIQGGSQRDLGLYRFPTGSEQGHL